MDWTHAKTGKHAVAVGIFAHCCMHTLCALMVAKMATIKDESLRRLILRYLENEIPSVILC